MMLDIQRIRLKLLVETLNRCLAERIDTAFMYAEYEAGRQFA